MDRQTSSSTDRSRGFTLMELMVVIVILGILMAIVAPRMMGSADEANRLQAKQQCDSVRDACNMYKLKHNKLPSSLDELTREDPKNYNSAYIESRDLTDPWDNELEYRIDGSKFEIISYGADGSPGGEAFDADISSQRPLNEEPE